MSDPVQEFKERLTELGEASREGQEVAELMRSLNLQEMSADQLRRLLGGWMKAEAHVSRAVVALIAASENLKPLMAIAAVRTESELDRGAN